MKGNNTFNYSTVLPSGCLAISVSFLVPSNKEIIVLNFISKERETGKVEFHTTGYKSDKC